ncbi:MAG: DNA-3-methyladenine glycosylase family protein [Emergencia sp.]
MRYTVENIRDFNLDHIFDCGQCFRWERREDGSYTGIAMGKAVNMRLEQAEPESGSGTGGATGCRLVIDNCTAEEFEKIWRPYLDLDRDYGKIKRKLSRGDKVMSRAVRHGEGIRILQQDLWETILSFIISQNNNIPRIRGCIEKLAELFGEPVCTCEGRLWHELPGPEVLAGLSVEDLAPVRLGYRAKYLIGTAKAVAEKGLPEDREQLSELPGVGPKVAGCIRLFGMEEHSAFPIDVWVARVMHELYGIDEKDRRAMEDYAREHFGQLGGFAQQYLFYYIRSLGR